MMMGSAYIQFSFTASGHAHVASIMNKWMYTHGSNNLSMKIISSQDGDTALMIASSNDHSCIVEVLLQAGATINTTYEVK